jgi:hypothetical protein
VINKWAYIRVGLYSGGGAYIWNEVSVSTCGGLIHGGGAYIQGGAYIRMFTVWRVTRATSKYKQT